MPLRNAPLSSSACFFSITKAQSNPNIEKREMDEASEMEVEEQQQPVQNNQSSTKRFGLKNSIQTNFGDDYVFQIVPKYASSHKINSNYRKMGIFF